MSAKVAAKVLKVMEKVDYLQKDGKIAFGATRYNYLSEEKITTEIRKAMREAGLTIHPAKMEIIGEKEVQTKTGVARILNVLTTYRLTDVESGEYIEAQAIGEGMDSGDKTVYKAMTGAFKYVQRQTFMIPTGDDPDRTASDELTGAGQTQPQGAAPPAQTGEATPPTGKTGPVGTTAPKMKATEKQLKALYATAREKNVDADKMKAMIAERFGKQSSKELTKQEASALIADLQAA